MIGHRWAWGAVLASVLILQIASFGLTVRPAFSFSSYPTMLCLFDLDPISSRCIPRLSPQAEGTGYVPVEINQFQRIQIDDGRFDYVKGCPPGGINDFLYASATVYIVPTGMYQDGQQLTDVSGAFNPITAVSGGKFFDEVIGSTSKTGTGLGIGPGTYAIIYDECQDTKFNASTDSVFDPAFTVTIKQFSKDPVEQAAIENVFRSIVTDTKQLAAGEGFSAEDIADLTQLYAYVSDLLLEVITLPTKPVPAFLWAFCKTFFADLAANCPTSIKDLALDVFQATAEYVAVQNFIRKAAHYFAIHEDPVDPDFKQLSPLPAREVIDPTSEDNLALPLARLASVSSNENAILSALLSSIERLDGADVANDPQWMLIHARAIRHNADLLLTQLDNTNGAISDVESALTSDTRPLDTAAAEIEAFVSRIESSDFSADEIRELKNLGLTDEEINQFKTGLAALDFSFSKGSFLRVLDEIKSTNEALKANLETLSGATDTLIVALEADPLSPFFNNAPVASAGGPYMGTEGVSITFDGTLSNSPNGIVSYEWDLDGDGEFDDAAGPVAPFTYKRAFKGLVGLKVTDINALSNIAYAFVEVTNVNDPPNIDSVSPETEFLEVTTGTSETFSFTAFDPEGDSLNKEWSVDLVPVAEGQSFIFSPTVSDLGVHVVRGTVSDDSPSGGSVSFEWIVSVVLPDVDGDGWNANVDCDETDPNVNPGMLEVVGNDIDDDCNHVTEDTGTPPIAGSLEVITNEDIQLDIALTAQDTDFGQTFTFNIVTEPSYGTLSGTAPNLVYTPNAGFTGTDSFTYKVNDGIFDSEVATVTITVRPSRPLANDQSVSTIRNTPIDIVLSATDPNKDPLTLSIVSEPAHGTLSNILASPIPPPEGLIGWWPGDANADDVINANHGTLQNGARFVPGMVGEAFSFDGVDDHVQIPDKDIWDFEAGDFTIDLWVNFNSIKRSCTLPGGEIFIGHDTRQGPARKWFFALGCEFLYFHINSRFIFAFLAPAPFSPNPHQWYHLAVTRSETTYTIFVNGEPVSSQTIERPDVIANANAPLTMGWAEGSGFVDGLMDEVEIYNRALSQSEVQAIFTAGSLGKAQPGLSRGLVTYTPASSYTGPDSFKFKANDGSLDSNIATVSIDVTLSPNKAPVANDQSAVTSLNTPARITLTGSDEDGDALTFSIETPSDHGTLSGIVPNLTYTPDSGFIGFDSFTFKVNDGQVDSNIATVSITIVSATPGLGNLFVSSTLSGGNIVKINLDTFASEEILTGLSTPEGGVCGSDGQLYFTLTGLFGGPRQIIRFDQDGNNLEVVLDMANVPELANSGGPEGPSFSSAGDLFFNTRSGPAGPHTGVWKISGAQSNATPVQVILPFTSENGEATIFLTKDPFAGDLLAADFPNNRVIRVPPPFDVAQAAIDLIPSGAVSGPNGLAINSAGDLFVAESGGKIKRFAPDGSFLGVFADTGRTMRKIAFDVEDNLYAAAAFGGPVIRISPDGSQVPIATVPDGNGIAICPRNSAPVANDQFVVTNENTPIDISLTGSDPDGDPLTFSILGGPSHGALSGTEPNLAYTPEAGFEGTDSFTFIVNDGKTNSNTGTIFIMVKQFTLPLTKISTNFNNPIGIDHHPSSGKVVMSVHYSNGQPYNFELVSADGTRAQFSNINGLTDEVKIATVRDTLGGFIIGELFAGTGVVGHIVRISPDGLNVQNPWVVLPGELGLMRGSLHVDRTGVFNGDLIVVTTVGNVWRVSSSGVPTKLAGVGTHLEGVTTVPNEARYGPWAGKIVAGAEQQGRFYTIDPAGNTAFYELGINPEDIDIIPANENFFGVDFGGRTLWGAPAAALSSLVGDLLVAQEVPGLLFLVRWDTAANAFQKTLVAEVAQWEHVTFSPAGIREVPPFNHVPVPDSQSVETNENSPVGITLTGSDADGDPLTFSIVTLPAHGTLSTVASSIPPPQGLIGWWPLDETSGTSAADIVNGNTATLTNGPVFTTGMVSNALSFDGIDDYARVAASPSLNVQSLTIDAWIFPTDLSTTRPIIEYSPDAGFAGVHLWLSQAPQGFGSTLPGALYANVRDTLDRNHNFGSAGPVLTTNEWNHVTLTYGQITGLGTLYVNGDVVAQANLGTFTPKTNVDLFMGLRPAEGVNIEKERHYSGMMDEVEIFNRALSQSEIKSIFDAGAAGKSLLGLSRGSVTYTPDPNFSGDDSFTFKVNDGQVDSSIATVSITVNPVDGVNNAPIADNQILGTNKNTALTLTLSGSDIDGDALTFSQVTGPVNGGLVITGAVTCNATAPGLCSVPATYTPALDYIGPDSFTFKTNDGNLDSNIATVSITVNPVDDSIVVVNDDPVANDDTVETNENTAKDIAFADVLANDSDPDGDMLSVIAVGAASHGSVSIVGEAIRYVPESGFDGVDTFTYDISDGFGGTATATVTVNVIPVNEAPILQPIDDQVIDEGTILNMSVSATDPDGTIPSLSFSGLPSFASFTDNGDGTGTINLALGFNDAGTYPSVQVIASDGSLTDTKTFTIIVNDINTAPIANDQSVFAEQNEHVFITLTGSDAEGDALTFSMVSEPASGTLLGSGSYLIYISNLDFAEEDAFKFIVNDGQADSNVATVSVTVNAGNNAPKFEIPPTPARGTTFNINTGETLTFPIQCADPDAVDAAVLGSLTLPTDASITPPIPTGNPAIGTFSWTPTSSQTVTITFICTDDHGVSAEHSVNIITIPILDVKIDIRPDMFPNTINPRGKWNIPVAMFSTETIDVTSMLDKSSLTFGRTGDEASFVSCNSSKDVNKDGLLDLICNFRAESTGFKVGDIEGILKGKTVTGKSFQGKDSVNIVQ